MNPRPTETDLLFAARNFLMVQLPPSATVQQVDQMAKDIARRADQEWDEHDRRVEEAMAPQEASPQ